LSVYLDASVVFPLIIADTHTGRVHSWLEDRPPIVLSDWTIAECSSAFGVRARLGGLSAVEREAADAHLDRWLAMAPPVLPIESHLIKEARTLLRQDPNLRAGDALHLALARDHGFSLASLDERLGEAAGRWGVALEPL